MLLALLFVIEFIFLVFIGKKTHAILEFKASNSGNPISLFFQDNKYCEWVVSKPDAGMIDDKTYGAFVVNSTYIDERTKNVFIPFNSSYVMSLNVKAAKMADDLIYIFKEKEKQKALKLGVMNGLLKETDGLYAIRTSINFSSLKHFVSPILPYNIKSKIVNAIEQRTQGRTMGAMQNIILLAISALGAIILGGLVLRFVVFAKSGA